MRLESVGKRYGLTQPWIVRDVTMEIPAGRLLRLEGRNGSGKSTLLRVLAGACRPSAGRVTGRPAAGYVPERFPPGLPFSPREYLTHLGRVQGLSGPGLAGQVDHCLERLGAAEYARAPMRTLSKGMCQKVAVAQALLPRPRLLVLDEAWTGLDQAARRVLDDAVAERLADGTAVVYVDHDQQRLAGLRPERWLVAAGRVGPAGGMAAGAPVHPDAGSDEAAAGAAMVVIEVSGAGEAGAVAALPGVRSVRAAGDRLVVTTAAARSDTVLRLLLAAGPAAHVLSVGPGEAAP